MNVIGYAKKYTPRAEANIIYAFRFITISFFLASNIIKYVILNF